MSSDSSDSKQKESIVVYGLSSEGYQIASKLAAKGHVVSLIDEILGTAMELRPEIAGDYRDLRSLLADEVLMSIKSSKESITKSKVIFFAPKIRRKDEEIVAEVKARIGDAAKNMSADTLFVYCLPSGISGTKDIIDKIEHSSGLVSGKEFCFAYAPLEAGRPTVFGCDMKTVLHPSAIEAAGLSTEVTSISKAELVHAQRVVAKYSTLASAFETARRLTQLGADSPRDYKQVFCEDLNANQFDLSLILESLETGDPILYLASGANKSIESYGRFLVERVREFVRVKEIKAARLKIILYTDTDTLEIRGGKLSLALDLVERLRDYFSDIEYLNIMKEGFSPPMGLDKTNLMIFLSGSAELKLNQLYEEQITMAKSHVMRANLPVEFVS
ncbi:MAG TPA: hypothetical protein VNE86_03805 [Nitrososphaerales archaeon]|nr:hypothetical protein [Nitrososphaerales archaeon]